MKRSVKIELPENIDCQQLIATKAVMRILYNCSALPCRDNKGKRILVVYGEMTNEDYDKIEKNLIELIKQPYLSEWTT